MSITRRQFVTGTSVAAGTLGLVGLPSIRAIEGRAKEGELLIVSTWPFARQGNEKAREVIQTGGSALDGVEQGIRLVETIGNGSVGLSGGPNAAGYVQQDACIMDGPGHRAGSVAGIEGIVHPITAARRVMENSKHVMLVGEGARWFALEQGLESVDVSGYPAMKEAWKSERLGAGDGGGHEAPDREDQDAGAGEGDDGPAPSDANAQGSSSARGEARRADRPKLPGDHAYPGEGHDTVALMVLHPDGTIAGGCSTSGAGGKLPGRVGDSPILGSGLYVDNAVGAAGGTGLGENAMRHCATFRIVELMRQGLSPMEACAEALHRMAAMDPLAYELKLSFCALDKQGRWGGATTHKFSCSVTTSETSEVHKIATLERR